MPLLRPPHGSCRPITAARHRPCRAAACDSVARGVRTPVDLTGAQPHEGVGEGVDRLALAPTQIPADCPVSDLTLFVVRFRGGYQQLNLPVGHAHAQPWDSPAHPR